MNVGIIIIVYNLSSEIFLLQMAAIKKFCKDDFTIEIVDNSSNMELAEQIKYHAEQLGLNYYKTFANSNNGSDSHSFAANFAHQKFKDTYKFFIYLDHDIIPLKDFSVAEILNGGHVMAGLGQGAKKTYFWPGCVCWSAERVDGNIIDFSPNGEYGLDTGGNLYKVVEQYGKEACIFFNEAYYQNPDFNGVRYAYYAMINNEMFCHIVNSSNWALADKHQERVSSMINLIKQKAGL